jgi:hypothetical protein
MKVILDFMNFVPLARFNVDAFNDPDPELLQAP